MSNTNTLPIGTILRSGTGNYKIVKVLGQGGFGITYFVLGEVRYGNVTTEAKFAIKEHFPTAFSDREGTDVKPQAGKETDYSNSLIDFISEARKLHAMGTQNDNIVKVNEVFEANGTAYYVMQYINGESLSSYVNSRGKLSYKEAMKLLSPIFDAVDFLHQSRINHLDIKPDNIMLHDGMDGTVPVLIDFGLSVHFKKNGEKTSPKGVQGVSEGYSPLEQYAGVRTFIPATDIYALTATLLFCLTGKAPDGASEIRLSDVRSSISKLVPPSAVGGICKALNKSYEDRTSSVALLKSDLGLVEQGRGSETRVIETWDEGRKKSDRYRTLFIITAVCFGLALLLMFLFKSDDHESYPSPVPDPTVADSTILTDQQDEEVMVPKENEEKSKKEEAKEIEAKKEKDKQKEDRQKEDRKKKENEKVNLTPIYPEDRHTPTQNSSNGSLSLGYATWKGGISNGKPNGEGRLVFHSAHKVDKSTSYVANPGDYFVATYDNGRLINGRLYDSSGNLLKTIIP